MAGVAWKCESVIKVQLLTILWLSRLSKFHTQWNPVWSSLVYSVWCCYIRQLDLTALYIPFINSKRLYECLLCVSPVSYSALHQSYSGLCLLADVDPFHVIVSHVDRHSDIHGVGSQSYVLHFLHHAFGLCIGVISQFMMSKNTSHILL